MHGQALLTRMTAHLNASDVGNDFERLTGSFEPDGFMVEYLVWDTVKHNTTESTLKYMNTSNRLCHMHL